MAKITLKFNETVLKEIQLDREQLTIGRKPDNDLVIDNPAVSGHHARITQVQGVFFIEDLGSTNGTFVNEKKIDRRQLNNTDRVIIGKHLLLYQEEVKSPPAPPPPAPKPFDADKTMILDTQKQRELLKADQATPAVPKAKEKVGVLQIVEGSTDRKEYQLTGRLAIIGSQDNATVKLKGWFAPKTAALVSRRNEGYYVSLSEESKKVLLNGQPIQGRADLKDGDLLEIAGVKMYFYLKD
jgi:pSer/pThr/pTyr-binding forkhead associated (FHA) protein